MKLPIIFFAIIAVATARPPLGNDEQITKLPDPVVVLTPVEVVDAGPVVNRPARQFYDNTNFNQFNQQETFAGPGGFENIRDSGVDFSQQIGFGGAGIGFGGGFNNGGVGGFGGGIRL